MTTPAAPSTVLNAEIARLASQGWTVSSVSEGQAVLQRKKRIGWFWNLLLAVVTGGLWLIVVIVRLINRKVETIIITTTPDGRVISNA